MVNRLETAAMEDGHKANCLGLALMNLVGEEVLREAVSILRRSIKDAPKLVVTSIETLLRIRHIKFDTDANDVTELCQLVSGQTALDGYRARLLANVATIRKMKLDDTQKGLALSALLVNEFGEEILNAALSTYAPSTAVAA